MAQDWNRIRQRWGSAPINLVADCDVTLNRRNDVRESNDEDESPNYCRQHLGGELPIRRLGVHRDN